ncbi:hypothetical protein OG233_26450 [Streptomyces sp. NBC_01218]|uniref:hypothetical protein n=1 Tax=unclassified Streptomyces TaxID=2593676 RepID=UPI0023B8BB15|nr:MULTISPECIES: hypothetical protein [unclassified Streptomyces]WEH42771.1 hypothetical protein PZB77_26520 [Streptomyces sp. AM 2-1-1]WSQ54407.1 hypothetical protein OG233_26450 [Streptomyces sp. NBC_01218]
MSETDRTGTPAAGAAAPKPSFDLGTGPGRVLVWFYGVFTVAAASRAIVQVILDFEKAPLAYVLSAVAALVYGFITYSLVRGGEKARRAALVCCAAELTGVLVVGTWTLLEPSAFADATVWSDFGMGYVFIPVILPVTGLLWLRRAVRV